MQERSWSLFLQKSLKTNPSLSALFFIDMRSCLHPSSCRERRETTLDYTMPFWTPLLKGCDKEPNYTIFSEDSLSLTACISLLKKEIPPIRGMSCFRQWVLRSTRPKRKGYYLQLLVGFFFSMGILNRIQPFFRRKKTPLYGARHRSTSGKTRNYHRGVKLLEINGLVKCKADGSVDR
jgi:hypothetical protein